MKVNMKITNEKYTPEYATEGAAGMDLKARLEEPVTLLPRQRTLVPTGVFIELPEGYEAQIRARSGLASKFGITLISGVGTIDSDYRGELHVPLINQSEHVMQIKDGDRIAQMVVTEYTKIEPHIIQELSETTRGTGGFGHTGV
jgi:dUTP pyrophosphatase